MDKKTARNAFLKSISSQSILALNFSTLLFIICEILAIIAIKSDDREIYMLWIPYLSTVSVLAIIWFFDKKYKLLYIIEILRFSISYIFMIKTNTDILPAVAILLYILLLAAERKYMTKNGKKYKILCKSQIA